MANIQRATLPHLEAALQARHLGGRVHQATIDRMPVERRASGVPSLDAALGGGWPCGAISEIIGPHSSGRTWVMVSTLIQATAMGQVAALIDPCDRFDPRSAIEAGLDPTRLLWIRGPEAGIPIPRFGPPAASLEHQALRSFDLILRAGGFAVIVLDVADLPVQSIRRLPQATWLRLAYVNEGRPSVGLLLGQAPTGRSAQGISVHLTARPIWTGTSAQSRRFAGFETSYRLQAARPLPTVVPSERARPLSLERCG